MNLSWTVWSGWAFAAGMAILSAALLMQARSEHVKGKLVAALGGTGAAHSPYEWPRDMHRVVLVGGSRIAQWPLPPPPTGYHIIKRGRGGETSLQLAARIPDLLLEHEPDIVVISTGMNDLVAATLSPKHAARLEGALLDNITQITSQIQDAGAKPVLSTIIQPARPGPLRRLLAWNGDIHSSVHRINENLIARDRDELRILDANAALQAGSGPLASQWAKDALHLKPAAYTHLSNALLEEIKSK